MGGRRTSLPRISDRKKLEDCAMRKHLAALVFGMACLVPVQAGAIVVTSIPGGTVIPMPALDYFGGGPQIFGTTNVVTWSSTNDGIICCQGGSVFGYTGG